jgi:hypothetical protein
MKTMFSALAWKSSSAKVRICLRLTPGWRSMGKVSSDQRSGRGAPDAVLQGLLLSPACCVRSGTTEELGVQVKRYDGTTGAFIDVFASTNLAGPTGMTIHQGALYVTNSNPPQSVQRFDATTGVNTGNFVPSLTNPSPRDVKVNPANNRLYVLYYNAATVETFDLATMASAGLLMPAGGPIGSGGLYTPSAMAFGPDGNLYISGGTFGGNLGVRRYDPMTGALIDFFANTGSDLYVPIGIAFGPDNNLYVATQNAANVMRFHYPSGAFMDFFVPDGGSGLTAPFHLTFGTSPAATLTYTLRRECLNNVDDPGMRWQIEGGKVLENGKHVANYSSVKRVSCGTTEQNTAQLWVTRRTSLCMAPTTSIAEPRSGVSARLHQLIRRRSERTSSASEIL